MKVAIFFDRDDLGPDRPRPVELLDLPVLPSPGMHLQAPNGEALEVRQTLILRKPDGHGAVAHIVLVRD